MYKIFTGFKVKGKKKTALGLNRLSWFLLRHNFLFEKDTYLYASLKIKVLFSSVLIALFFSTLLSLFVMHVGESIITKSFHDQIKTSTQNIAFSFHPKDVYLEKEQMAKKLETTSIRNDLHYLILLDKNDNIVAFIDNDNYFSREVNFLKNQNKYSGYEKITTNDGTIVHHCVHPVPNQEAANKNILTGDNKTGELATILVGFKNSPLKRNLSEWYRQSAFISISVISLLVIMLYFVVTKMVKPFKQLVDATDQIAKGNLNFEIVSDRQDELGLLANAFNDMILKVKLSQAKLTQYTQTLEEKVKERTRMYKTSEEKYRALFEHSASAVTLIDSDSRLTMVNKQFERLARCRKEEVEGKRTFSSFLRGQDKEIVEDYLLRQKNGSWDAIPFNFECAFYDENDHKKKINLTMAILPGSTSILASLVDVTGTRELQQKLNRSEHLAAIGELSASIAHEIRNPLGAINTSVGVLMSGLELEGDDRELMEIIDEEIRRLDRIINDFLKFARLTGSELHNVDCNQVVNDTITLFKGLIGDSITLHVSQADNLPDIKADMDQLKQVCINIIMNAADAMHGTGDMWVSTELLEDEGMHEMLSIRIKDSGDGIKVENLKKIFQPFFSTKETGGGMGLSICERIIQNHGGFIKVKSTRGEGTEFDIRLPIMQDAEKEQEH